MKGFNMKRSEVLTAGIAGLALVLSVLTTYMQFFHTSSKLRAMISGLDAEYSPEKKLWVLTCDVSFMNIGSLEQIVLESRVGTLKKKDDPSTRKDNSWTTESSSAQLFQPFVIKPGEIHHERLTTYACEAPVTKTQQNGQVLSLENLSMTFRVINADGESVSSGFRIGSLSHASIGGFLGGGGGSSFVRPTLMDLRTAGDIPAEAIRDYETGRCIQQDQHK